MSQIKMGVSDLFMTWRQERINARSQEMGDLTFWSPIRSAQSWYTGWP